MTQQMLQSKIGGNAAPSILVAAIDFGTTYSGWAFSFKHEFDSDPIKVSAKQWTGGQLVSSKGPTCVLIKPDGKTLHSFAFDAETKYAELAEEGEHKDWYFFKRFKMMLFGKIGIQRNIMLEDATEKKLPAKTVFSLAIRFLKDDLLSMSKQRLNDGGLDVNDIHWVLTVPAIWNDAAKQFMREAAETAGIPGANLTIALEPEAASLYCRHLPVERHVGTDTKAKFSLAKFKAGTKYLVLDAGGGTVDITVHEVMEDAKLKELHKASGGAWGGTKVDEAFRQFIIKLVGGPVVKKFQEKHMEDYLEIFRDFEIKKRDIGPSRSGKITIRMPISLMELFEQYTDETLKEAIPQTIFANQISITGDKMRVDVSVFKKFFQEPVDSVIEHVGNLLREPSVKGCVAIVMVGGFSESPMLQETVKTQFPSVKVIVPDEAGLAVLKGAVIYGHCPQIIAERVSKFTYGVECTQSYVKDRHPEHRKIKNEDDEFEVENVFNIYVKAGQKIRIDEEFKDEYRVARADQDGMSVIFHYTVKPDPMFIDETGCNKLGTMQVDVPGYGKDRKAIVSLRFGKTEIEASTKVIHTDKVTTTKFDFLG
ncbi:heat shock 70 kDa protein 12A-like [Ruditapes philippinarum]|uniref:heat shock 70 kDa protein 12A-like n=1 Tax=Ruditapes philippinarum TaxID=129788 RepID=UPI00295B0867|nr:heat shock 70 kDa protein 12A-like [Ruditapes philippinarum]